MFESYSSNQDKTALKSSVCRQSMMMNLLVDLDETEPRVKNLRMHVQKCSECQRALAKYKSKIFELSKYIPSCELDSDSTLQVENELSEIFKKSQFYKRHSKEKRANKVAKKVASVATDFLSVLFDKKVLAICFGATILGMALYSLQ